MLGDSGAPAFKSFMVVMGRKDEVHECRMNLDALVHELGLLRSTTQDEEKRMIPRDQQRGRSWIYMILVLLLTSATALAGTTGSLTGNIQSPDGKELSGVKVTLTGPVLQGSRTVISDSRGFFQLTQLPPGDNYRARFDATGFNPTERTGIRISIDARIKLPTVVLKPVQSSTGVVEVIEERPVVEQGTTTIGKNLSSEFMAAVPLGRTSTAVLALAPGASSDALGVTFRGATSPENSYVVDGLNTTGVQYGLASSNLPPEFIQEIQVKTGGYEPEYGRATGGQAIVITKSGGNEFHGDVFLYATPFYGPAKIAPTNVDNIFTPGIEESSFIQQNQSKLFLNGGFDLGGYLVKDRLWFFVGYAPSMAQSTRTWEYQQRCGGFGAAGTAKLQSDGSLILFSDPAFPTASGQVVTACYTELTKDTSKLAVAKTDYTLSDTALTGDRTTITHYYLANLTFNINSDHAIRLSASGSPSSDTGIRNAPVGDPGTFLSSSSVNTMDVSATYNGKFAGGLVNLDVILGHHTESDATTPFTGEYTSDNANDPFVGNTYDGYAPLVNVLRYNYSASRENPNNGVSENAIATGFEEKCLWNDPNDDVDDLVPGPCIYYGYGFGGFGGMDETAATRTVFKPILSLFLNNMVGNHVIKLGGDVEVNHMINKRTFTGGSLIQYRTAYARERYYSLNGLPVVYNKEAGVDWKDTPINWYATDTSTQNTSVFLQDNWNLLSNLSLNLGVRWEMQQIKDVNGIARITIPDNVAPRLGLIFDFTNQGKSKLFANYGRYYESIPQDINDRALSAEGFRFYQFKDTGTSSSFTAIYTPSYFPGEQAVLGPNGEDLYPVEDTGNTFGSYSFSLGGTQAYIQSNLKGQYKDSFILGFEYEAVPDLSLGITGIHENLGQVIEDISPDDGTTYIIANPDADNYYYLEVTDPNGPSEEKGDANGNPFRRCFASFDPLTGSPVTYCFPKATRSYNALELTATKRFSGGWQALASYTASQTYGNYPGLFASTNGQLDPNITSQFDLANLLVNRGGPLDSDRTHNFKLSGAYSFKVGATIGMTASVQSGLPILYLGGHPAYGGNEAFLLPRGVYPSDGQDLYIEKTPWLLDIDMNARYALKFANKQQLSLGLQVSNLLNAQEAVRVNQTYTTDYANPSVGGENLSETQCYGLNTFTANISCTPNPSYQQATTYQAPMSLRLEAKYSF